MARTQKSFRVDADVCISGVQVHENEVTEVQHIEQARCWLSPTRTRSTSVCAEHHSTRQGAKVPTRGRSAQPPLHVQGELPFRESVGGFGLPPEGGLCAARPEENTKPSGNGTP